MSLIKIGISDLSPAELVLKGTHIVNSMTGNANFTTPNPDLATVDAALGQLAGDTMAAFDRDKQKIAIRNQQAEVVKGLLRQLSAYVQNVSNGNEVIILSSGFGVRKTPEPVGIPTQVLNLSAKATDFAGELKIDWKPVSGSKSYTLELMDLGFQGADDTAVWQTPVTVTASKHVVSGLNSGHIYRVRVAAVGSAGQGPFSDIAEERAK